MQGHQGPQSWRRGRALRGALALLLWAAVQLSTGGPALASGVYFTRAELLTSFFHDADRVSFRAFELDPAQRRRLAARLGYPVDAKRVIYLGEKAGRVTGYAILDDELGQHQPISFGVLVGLDGQVKRVEVMVYREPKGEEIRRAPFRAQFVGKDADEPLQAGRDIVAIAGATLSSRSLAVGVKRALVLVDELVLHGGGGGGSGSGAGAATAAP